MVVDRLGVLERLAQAARHSSYAEVVPVLRDVAENRPLGDTTTLADPAVVAEIKTRAESEPPED